MLTYGDASGGPQGEPIGGMRILAGETKTLDEAFSPYLGGMPGDYSGPSNLRYVLVARVEPGPLEGAPKGKGFDAPEGPVEIPAWACP